MYRSLLAIPWYMGILIAGRLSLHPRMPRYSMLAAEHHQVSQGPTVLIPFRQPDTDEASDPRDRPRGGGSRRICKPGADSSSIRCTNQQLTALVPSLVTTSEPSLASRAAESSAWGQTLEARPTLWFYVPYSAQSVHQVVFELFDGDGTEIEIKNTFDLVGAPGVIGYRPDLAKALEVNKTYRWHLLLKLDPKNPSGDAYISGRIKRIAMPPNLEQRLHSQDALQVAKAFADAGIWYDTLTALAHVQPQQSRYWRSLLQSVGLGDLSQEPIVQ